MVGMIKVVFIALNTHHTQLKPAQGCLMIVLYVICLCASQCTHCIGIGELDDARTNNFQLVHVNSRMLQYKQTV